MRTRCEHCGTTDLSWIDKRFGHCRRRVPKAQLHNRRYGYREDLARFPGDPEAYVASDRGLSKLIDKRKAAGWQQGKPLDEIERELPYHDRTTPDDMKGPKRDLGDELVEMYREHHEEG